MGAVLSHYFSSNKPIKPFTALPLHPWLPLFPKPTMTKNRIAPESPPVAKVAHYTRYKQLDLWRCTDQMNVFSLTTRPRHPTRWPGTSTNVKDALSGSRLEACAVGGECRISPSFHPMPLPLVSSQARRNEQRCHLNYRGVMMMMIIAVLGSVVNVFGSRKWLWVSVGDL